MASEMSLGMPGVPPVKKISLEGGLSNICVSDTEVTLRGT